MLKGFVQGMQALGEGFVIAGHRMSTWCLARWRELLIGSLILWAIALL